MDRAKRRRIILCGLMRLTVSNDSLFMLASRDGFEPSLFRFHREFVSYVSTRDLCRACPTTPPRRSFLTFKSNELSSQTIPSHNRIDGDVYKLIVVVDPCFLIFMPSKLMSERRFLFCPSSDSLFSGLLNQPYSSPIHRRFVHIIHNYSPPLFRQVKKVCPVRINIDPLVSCYMP